jgi:type IV pilus assembly protein PilW
MVELMVGVAVGLFVVAGAALMVSTQLAENRRMLLETQLLQDLRAATDIITRELRRASYDPTIALKGVWTEFDDPTLGQSNFGTVVASGAAGAEEVIFSYRRRSGDEGPFGFKQDGSVIRSLIGGQWQELTDSRVMDVTQFDINLAPPVAFRQVCPKLCPDGSTDCWPELLVRTASVTITGQSKIDPAVTRTLSTRVRMRNDFNRFNGADACPA